MSTNDTAEVYFEYRRVGNSEWSTTSRQSFTGPSTFGDVIGGLDANTEYEYRAVAESGDLRRTGVEIRFIPSEYVGGGEGTGEYASNVSAFSATLNANLVDPTSEKLHAWFRYRPVGSTEWTETERYVMTEEGSFPGGDIDGLQDDTEYEWQALLETYVADHSVTTSQPADIDFESATLRGELIALDGPHQATVGFAYGPMGSDLTDPQNNDDVELVTAEIVSAPAAYETPIDGLEEGTDYDVKAYSEAPILTNSPSTQTLRTDPALEVNGVTATNITETAATLRGDLTFLAFSEAEVSFEYREVGDSTWTQTSTQTVTSTGEYETDISGLTDGAEYEWRARADVSSEGRTSTGSTYAFTAGDKGEINLANDVPDYAWDVYQSKPDDPRNDYPTVDASDYDNRSGDLSELIRTASQDGAIVDLGSGTYEMETTVSTWDTLGDVVGVVGDGARIYYVGTHLEYLFNLTGDEISDVVLWDVTFDITEDPSTGSTDVSVMTTNNISNAVWCEDVRLEGSRERQQDLGNGYESVGALPTFMVRVDEGATALLHRCEFPDGGTDKSVETDNDSSHAIGPNCDPGHEGLNVWKECYCEGFYGNGYYMTTRTQSGENVLWDCHAKDNGKGGMRVSWGDTIVGGTTEVVSSGPRDNLHPGGQPLVCDYGSVDIIGLTVRAAGDDWNANAIQIRNSAETVNFNKAILEIQSGDKMPVRMNSSEGLEVILDDVYWYDGAGESWRMVGVSPPNFDTGATLTIDDASTGRVRSDGATEFEIGSNGIVSVEGSAYSDTSISSSDLGLGDPLGPYGELPQTYFDYSVR